jgi:hypothetical protein
MSIAEHNLAMIHHVAVRLGDFAESVVFLGGTTTTLLITDAAASDVRPMKGRHHRLTQHISKNTVD